jgi:hypothetical protein
MNPSKLAYERRQRLRVHAEIQLQAGTAPVSRGGITGSQALTLLHGLAIDPARAGDALKLLHELQVHQVELDLQQEETDVELGRASELLARRCLQFDEAPFGYLTLEPDGVVREVNRLGAAWLGVAVDACVHRHIEDLLDAASGPVIRTALAQLRDGGDRRRCNLRAAHGGGLLQAELGWADGAVLMAFFGGD